MNKYGIYIQKGDLMRHLEKIIASILVLVTSVAVYADEVLQTNEEVTFVKTPNRNQQATRFSIRDEQVDRDETIYLLNGVETDEEEARILENRLEVVKERLQGVSPECRGF